MALNYDQMGATTDPEGQKPCTPEENRKYNELLYVLTGISNDVHFIKNVVQAGLIIGIIAGAILLIFLMYGL